jgi:biotin carboxylase
VHLETIKNMSATVLITQCHVRFGYNVLKSLLKGGYSVAAGSQEHSKMNQLSGDRIIPFSYPDPFLFPEEYIRTISAVANKVSAKYILPVHEDIFVCALYRDLLPSHCELLAPPISKLMKAHDKLTISEVCQSSNIPSPESWKIINEEHCLDLISSLPWDNGFVVKPRFGEGSHGVVAVCNKAALTRKRSEIIKQCRNSSHSILQRFASGSGVGIGSLRYNGMQIALSGHKRIREIPITGGTSTARRTFVHKEMFQMSQKLLSKLDLDGICMVEFRFDSAKNQFLLIDVNPRYWGGLSTHLEAGVDYPTLQVGYVSGQISSYPTQPITPSRLVESRWALGEIRACTELLARGRITEAIQVIRRTSDAEVVYEDLDSIETFLGQLVYYGRRAMSSHAKIRPNRNNFFDRLAEGIDA